MEINKYRWIKSMRYEDIQDIASFQETFGYKVLQFMKDNNISEGDLIFFDVRMLAEKSE